MQNSIFNPFIQFFHFSNDNQLGLLFDPSGQSPERQSHAMAIPSFAYQATQDMYPPYISIVAKNFNESVLGTKKIFICEFFLVVDNREYIIGKYQELVLGKSKGIFKRSYVFSKTISSFEQEITHRLASEFSYAWSNYANAMLIKNSGIQNQIQHTQSLNNQQINHINRKNENINSNKTFYKWLAAAVAIPVVLALAIWSINTKMEQQNSSQKMLSDLLKNNPQAAQGQIDLNNQVLSQMGLNTAKSNDVGCLTSEK
jgi:hypothetical protein